jgi:hypothetical protein
MASGHHPLCPMRGCLREPPERSGHPLAQRLISPLLARGTQLGGGDPGGGLTAPRMRLSSSPCMVSVMGRHTTVTPDRPTYRPSQATRRSSRNRSFNVACLPGMTVSVFLAAWCGRGADARSKHQHPGLDHLPTGRASAISAIPACAGKHASSVARRRHRTVHPRMRREHASSARRPHIRRGSSPPARGTHLGEIGAGLLLRFIPACAGNTMTRPGSRSTPPVHPRMRGEHAEVGDGRCKGAGSSPARAGNTLHTRLLTNARNCAAVPGSQ